jgi:prepilin-type N-terminal cleavage/methylation domain-containing protein
MSALPTRSSRGFTLIELLTASAVGGVILLAALATFDLQRQFSRNTERLLGAESTASLALTMMQRDLENAGYRFHGGPSDAGGYTWAVVVRPYDNLGTTHPGTTISTLKNDPTGSTTISVAASGTAGFLYGTDAFEVMLGSGSNDPQRLGSQVLSVSGAGNQITVNISPDPFNPAEIAAASTADGPLLMFWTAGRHCMGRVTSYVSASANVARVTVNSLDADLGNAGTAWAAGCPAPQQRAEVFAVRRRYLVYQNAAVPGQPAQIGLYVQTNNCDPFVYDAGQACSPNLGQPRMVSGGIDDLQIAWQVPAGMADGGTPAGWCQTGPPTPYTSCGLDQASGWNTPLAASIYGAQIFVVSQGPEPLIRPNAGDGKPQLLNRPPEPGDDVARTVMQTSVVFRNQVTP